MHLIICVVCAARVECFDPPSLTLRHGRPVPRRAGAASSPQPTIDGARGDVSDPARRRRRRRSATFCDVMSGRDPAAGILIPLPPHRGPVTLSFDLHNRHTYSEER